MKNEQEVKGLFLDEAKDYLAQIESGILGLSKPINRNYKTFDSMLRAAHSIKGGAAMMGYETLRNLAHRLEDFLKVISASEATQVDVEIEGFLLESVDCLQNIITLYHQNPDEIEQSWLERQVNPVFDELHLRLGEPKIEDTTKLVRTETGEEITVLLFETEVESCLQRLEEVLNSPEQICLKEEFILAAQELGGLGEMLDLNNFSSLCTDIHQQLETADDTKIVEIAKLALATWQRSQALILVGQVNNLPLALEIEEESFLAVETLSLNTEELSLSPEDFSFLPEGDFLENATLSSTEVKTLPTSDAAIPIEDVENENTIRVAVRQLEQLSDLVGELNIERTMLNLQLSALKDLSNLLKTKVKTLYQSNSNLRILYDNTNNEKPQKFSSSLSLSVSSSSHIPHPNIVEPFRSAFDDRLEMDRYNEQHIFLQELIEKIVQVQEVTEDIDLKLEEAGRKARNLTRTSQLLQNHVTQVRMRPFSDLVKGFPRAIREMELRYGKQVKLKIFGSSILIDRTILEALKDPIIHLLRNAFDHGIEKPNERLQKGKVSVGTIEISSTYKGNQTVITLSDDGAGIDFEKIRLAAFEMGLEESMLINASEKELLDLMFEPGFTTASQVSELSGRGLGMDIVRTQIKQIRGQIQVDTIPEKGTTFTISVPFTLSVVRVLLLESGGIMFAVPSNAVEEMLIADSQMLFTQAGVEYLTWDESMIAFYSLRDWLQFAHPHIKPQTDAVAKINQPVVLVIAQAHERVALKMDSYWGEQEVSIRAIEGPIKLPTCFTGCTILGDGRVVPLIDTVGLLSLIEQNRSVKETAVSWGELEQTERSTQSKFDETVSQPKNLRDLEKATVMVVDDSITIRRFLALTLEKAGYQVEQAKDGQDALEKLKSLPITAVICDVEMPRLDGYGFLSQVKSDPLFQSLPIMMLTSRSGDKHRQIAFDLGAIAYFSKPFQTEELLKTLASVLE